MKYHITTYGCAQNLSDSERIDTVLLNLGFSKAASEGDADFIIYNTCSVKQKAEDRVLGLRRVWQRLREKNPKLVIAITGCMVSHGRYDLAAMLPEVDILFGITELPALPSMLTQYFDIDSGALQGSDFFDIQPTNNTAFQGLIPIMTGCNKFCSYCIVPYARGREVSRKPEGIINEAEYMVSSGIKEIMLLGQNVDSYLSEDKQGNKVTFADLLRMVDPIEGLERIRYLSPYPTDMTDDAIQAVKELRTVCEHIHLPLQAGSTRMLYAMNRRYTKEQYLALVKKIKKEIPGVALTTDIIVGFCGETEEDFQETLAVYDECSFDMAFISMYSERPGTRAATMPDDVSYEEKKNRWEKLNTYVKKYSHQNNETYIGKTVEILVEEVRKNGKVYGKTRTWKTVQFDQDNVSVGDIIQVTITDVTAWALNGRIAA